jgi:hypothetical protein
MQIAEYRYWISNPFQLLAIYSSTSQQQTHTMA